MTDLPSKKHLFCFGLGFTGQALGRALLADGWRVSGTCRAEDKRERLIQAGFEAHRFDGTAVSGPVQAALAEATHVLSTVPPVPQGDPVLLNFAETLASGHRRWVGYLSTTGVYGNRQGAWVSESTEPQPESGRGRLRLQVETQWRELYARRGLPVQIFRLTAIYGPGRNALERVRQGRARRVDQPGLVFSRVHLDDVVAVLLASMERPRPGRIYNVADDHPAPPGEVVGFACSLLGVAPPPWQSLAEAGLSEMAHSFYQDSKRVSNDRIKEELGVRLRFVDYQSGLRALLNHPGPETVS